MKILIVGAGAVGQVYGWHLRQAGHEVTFFVKEKYREEVARGLTLYRLGYGRSRRQDWPAVSVISSVQEVATQPWDQVWLTLASDALRGELAGQVLAQVGQATVVCLQPDIEDGAYVRSRLPTPGQMVQGLITFISYQSPLPGGSGPEGIAYFLPPLAPGLFAGEAARVGPVVTALKAGGISAKVVRDFAQAAAGAPALLQPLMAALEVNDWKLHTLNGSQHMKLGLAASREALTVAKAEAGANTGLLSLLLRPTAWRLIVPLSQRVLPMDVETYLKYHYGKVGVQSRLMLDSYIRLGGQHGLDTQALQALRAAMPAVH